MDVTPEALAPILKSGWSGARPAMVCLWAHRTILERAVTAVAFQYRSLNLDAAELTQETLVKVMEKATREEGLTAGDMSNPAGWLYTVFKNKATEHARRVARTKRWELHADSAQHRSLEERAAPAEPHTAAEDDRLTTHDLHQQLQGHLCRLDQLAPLRALAWLIFVCPEMLAYVHVCRAAQTTSRTAADKTTGLMRTSEETWSRLVVWRNRYGSSQDDRSSRRLLAWIFRSNDPHDPETWRRADPKGMRKGLDAVRKWAARAREDLGGRR